MLNLQRLLDRNYLTAAAVAVIAVLPVCAQTPIPFRCAVTSVPTLVRAEGLTERAGDIVLSCKGGAPTAAGKPIPQANFVVSLNTNVTSRILSNGGSEALVMIDEPGTTSNPVQRVCANLNGCVVTGNGGTAEPFDGSDATRPNVFQGIVAGNQVTFLGVPVEAPPSGVRTYRITNVRANANTLFQSATSLVMASVAISGSTSVPLDNPVRVVGNVLSALTFASGSAQALSCAAMDKVLAALVYDELYPSAFRTRTVAGPDPGATAVQNTPGADYNSESGLILPALAGAGLADFGTRFKAAFTNIPPGVTLWVSTKNLEASDTSTAQLVPSETGPYAAVAPTDTASFIDVVKVPVVNGAATVVWEVIATNPVVVEEFSFGMFFDSTAPLDPKTPPPTVVGTFAATSTPAGNPGIAQPATFAVPRFATSPTTYNVISPTVCQTILLFPYVTTQAGFDTGFAISNTTSDPINTTPQTGTCTLSAYGNNAPQPVTTAKVAPGTSYTALTSTLFPGFTGYVFAVCDFQFAHGFAFISDAGARNLAMGYLALVLQSDLDPLVRPRAPDAESKAR